MSDLAATMRRGMFLLAAPEKRAAVRELLRLEEFEAPSDGAEPGRVDGGL